MLSTVNCTAAVASLVVAHWTVRSNGLLDRQRKRNRGTLADGSNWRKHALHRSRWHVICSTSAYGAEEAGDSTQAPAFFGTQQQQRAAATPTTRLLGTPATANCTAAPAAAALLR